MFHSFLLLSLFHVWVLLPDPFRQKTTYSKHHENKDVMNSPGTFQAAVVREVLGGTFAFRQPGLDPIYSTFHFRVRVRMPLTVDESETIKTGQVTHSRGSLNDTEVHPQRKDMKGTLQVKALGLNGLQLLVLV